MGSEIIDNIVQSFGIDSTCDIRSLSPLTLAYVGDAVYEIIIRTKLVMAKDMTVQKYHKKCTSYVNCSAQRSIMEKLEPLLTEEEISVFHRGRNAKSYTMPKNATPSDYRNATGFEALVGFLYLMGRNDRLMELLTVGIKALGE